MTDSSEIRLLPAIDEEVDRTTDTGRPERLPMRRHTG